MSVKSLSIFKGILYYTMFEYTMGAQPSAFQLLQNDKSDEAMQGWQIQA